MLKDQKSRGRPMASRNVRVMPEFRDEPDIEKLGRALIAVALKIAEQKQAKEDTKEKASNEGEGDDMT